MLLAFRPPCTIKNKKKQPGYCLERHFTFIPSAMFSPLLIKKAAAVGSAADGFKEKSHGAVTRRGQLDDP